MEDELDWDTRRRWDGWEDTDADRRRGTGWGMARCSAAQVQVGKGGWLAQVRTLLPSMLLGQCRPVL